MSLPDYLLEEPDLCPDHGRELPCRECRIDVEDERADWIISERYEGRRRR